MISKTDMKDLYEQWETYGEMELDVTDRISVAFPTGDRAFPEVDLQLTYLYVGFKDNTVTAGFNFVYDDESYANELDWDSVNVTIGFGSEKAMSFDDGIDMFNIVLSDARKGKLKGVKKTTYN